MTETTSRSWTEIREWFEPRLEILEIKELSMNEKKEVRRLVSEAIDQEEAS